MTAIEASITWAAGTDVGQRRPHNEDAWGVFALGERAERCAPAGMCTPVANGLLLIVSDGIGGSLAGEVASAFCVERLPVELAQRGNGSPAAAMRAAFIATNDALVARSRANAEWAGMGATLSALWLLPQGLAVLGHVGDSRVYASQQGGVTQLAEEHSVGAGMVRRGEITAEAVARLRFRAMLERSMGGYGEPLEPQVMPFTWESGDAFLLCSDGLHGYVAHELVENALAQRGSEPPPDTVASLIAAANDAGGPDNITAVLARVLPGL